METLLYRLVARLGPSQLILGEGVPEAYADVAHQAQKGLAIQRNAEPSGKGEERQRVKEDALLLTRSLKEASEYASLQKGIILLLAPHKTAKRSEAFRRWAEAELQEGLVLDFYEGALITHVPKVRYLYRSSW